MSFIMYAVKIGSAVVAHIHQNLNKTMAYTVTCIVKNNMGSINITTQFKKMIHNNFM